MLITNDNWTAEEIASVCHEANRRIQLMIGDPVSPPWDELGHETRESVIDGVLNIINNEATPEESHANWCEFKFQHGWVYGEVKDEVEKTHPNLVPYEKLGYYQRVKDYVFHAIVRAMITREAE